MPEEATLNVYDSAGAWVRSIAMTRDERDPSKWHLAEDVSLGTRHAEMAAVRYADGTVEPVRSGVFSLTATINTIFLSGGGAGA